MIRSSKILASKIPIMKAGSCGSDQGSGDAYERAGVGFRIQQSLGNHFVASELSRPIDLSFDKFRERVEGDGKQQEFVDQIK